MNGLVLKRIFSLSHSVCTQVACCKGFCICFSSNVQMFACKRYSMDVFSDSLTTLCDSGWKSVRLLLGNIVAAFRVRSRMTGAIQSSPHSVANTKTMSFKVVSSFLQLRSTPLLKCFNTSSCPFSSTSTIETPKEEYYFVRLVLGLGVHVLENYHQIFAVKSSKSSKNQN